MHTCHMQWPAHWQQMRHACSQEVDCTLNDVAGLGFLWMQGHSDGTSSGTASAEGSLQHWARAKDAADEPGNRTRYGCTANAYSRALLLTQLAALSSGLPSIQP